MSFVFSSKKEKRSRSSTGESNSSFVKNVTSRVSGLLPATITRWFSSPSSSSTNGSAPTVDGTDSSTEDEAPESPSIVQPPAKRQRYSSPPGKYAQLTTSETTLTSNVMTETGSVLYNSIQSPPARHPFRIDTNFISTPIRSHMDESTIERPERDSFKSQHTVSAIGQSIAMKRKSLFDSPMAKEESLNACAKTAAHTMKDTKQPYFKPHLLGSPFYPGRTMYGGASASTTYINQPNIKQRKMTYVNESKNDETVNMSTSARRVLDLLENYSSPLVDAKRIPRYEMSETNDFIKSCNNQPSTSKRNSYKHQELYIPSMASIIQIKRKAQLMDSTKAARQIVASHSSTLSPYQPYAIDPKRDQGDNSGKSQSKLKSRLTRANRGEDPLCMPEPVQLPTAVLQIDSDNLPKFSFGGSNSLSTSTPKIGSASGKPGYESFTFSRPLPITPEQQKESGSPLPAFGFGSPERCSNTTSPSTRTFGNTQSRVDNVTPQPKKNDEAVITNNNQETVITNAKMSNDWKCCDCWAPNKDDSQKCVCCGAKRPMKQSESKSKCTVCKLANPQPDSDKCVNCEKMRINNQFTHQATKSSESSKWKCSDCWAENESGAEKCACCGYRNPQKGNALPTINKKEAVETERCENCLITNKPSVEKCAACGGAKPGLQSTAKSTPTRLPVSSNVFKDPDNKFAKIIQSQKSNWECRVCLTSNKADKSMCVCCDAEREVPNNNVASKYKNFKFSPIPNPGFNFGIDPKIQETKISKKVDEVPKPMRSEESETNNNIVPKIPSYTFTLPTKKFDEKADGPKADEGPKPSFSFGIPKQNATPTPAATGFVPIKVPSPTKLPDIVKPAEDKDKPQQVPSISLKTPEPVKPSFGMFVSPQLTSSNTTSMSAFMNNTADKNKTESPSNLSVSQPAATVEAAKPQFSFSAVKPSTGGLFSTPASTVAETGGSLIAQTAPTASMGSMPLFQKPETGNVPSLFQKSEPTTSSTTTMTLFQSPVATVGPAPTATAGPMFSFGSNIGRPPAPAAAPVTAPETQKFNFTFGSSTAPAFGATLTSQSNTFNLPSASNGLSNNPLGGNTISSTPLSARSITGNPLGVSSATQPAQAAAGSGMFSTPVKEMWPNTNEQANPFMANATKPTFAFGANQTQASFGSQTSQPVQHVFGATAQPAQNMFGQSNSQPTMFQSPAQNPAPMFGNPQPPANPSPSIGMFGTPNVTPFGAPNPTPSFEAPSMGSASTPAFNFGAPQSTPGVFGFGQQPQQAVQPQIGQNQGAGMYNFSGAASASPVQFTMGSAPSNTAGRRVRKAVRRNPR